MGRSTYLALGLAVAMQLLSSGCTHNQLRRNTVNQMSTVHELQLQQVLDNLAMFVQNRDSYPYYSIVTQGNSTLTDTGSLAVTSGFARTGGHVLFSALGINPSASRAAAEAWSISPINDSVKLSVMRCAYRRAVAPCVGAGPDGCPDCENLFKTFYGNLPAGVTRHAMAGAEATEWSGGDDNQGRGEIQAYRGAPPIQVIEPQGQAPAPPAPGDDQSMQDGTQDRTFGAPLGAGGGATPSAPSGSSPPWKHVQGIVTPDCINFRNCWFCYGTSLPKLYRKKCCMVGHYCGTYVWVPDESRDELTKLTLLIQDIAYYDPPSVNNPSGNQPTQFPQTAISTMQLFRAYAPTPGGSVVP